MEYKLLYALRSGKNIKLIYYIKNMLGMLIPNIFFQMQLRISWHLYPTEKIKTTFYTG